MKFIVLVSSIILATAVFSKAYFKQPKNNVYMINTKLNVEKRQGEIPITTPGIPHAQETQESSEEMMKALEEVLFSLPSLRKVSSRQSFPSAVGAYIDDSIPINGAVNREFIHIHRETGLGSMHATYPIDAVDEIVSKNWGIVHPMAKGWKNQKIVMIYAPRHKEDLKQIEKIIQYAYDYALAVE